MLLQEQQEHFKQVCEDNERFLQIQKHLKSQIYHAKEDDRTDKLLGEFINKFQESSPSPLKIMFLRESTGVYQFGQKRVFIKVEKGNKILVKVGGGFVNIEEFIKKFTQEQLDRLERSNVVEKFHNKTSIQTIALKQSINSYETSPIKSPQKARQIL